MTFALFSVLDDGVAPVNFYPHHLKKIATGNSGELALGGWTANSWAAMLNPNSIWRARPSAGTWEQANNPLSGFVPDSPIMTVRQSDHSADPTWTNTTTLYTIDVEFYLVSTLQAGDSGNKAAGSTSGFRYSGSGGDHVKFRARYNNGGVLGDWSLWATGIIPT